MFLLHLSRTKLLNATLSFYELSYMDKQVRMCT